MGHDAIDPATGAPTSRISNPLAAGQRRSPTQKAPRGSLSDMSTDGGAGHQGIQPEPTRNQPVRQPPNRLGTTVVLALVISVVAVALITSRTNSVRVPDLTGLAVDPNLDVVRTSLDTYHLVLGDVVVEECDPLQLPRTVADQSPAPGTSVPPGAAVAITICR